MHVSDLELSLSVIEIHHMIFSCSGHNLAIDHSENGIITQSELFENEIGPGVLQSNVQQTRALQEHRRHKPFATDYLSVLSLCEILQTECLLKTGLEHSRSSLVSKMHNNYIFGMLCWLVHLLHKMS